MRILFAKDDIELLEELVVDLLELGEVACVLGSGEDVAEAVDVRKVAAWDVMCLASRERVGVKVGEGRRGGRCGEEGARLHDFEEDVLERCDELLLSDTDGHVAPREHVTRVSTGR